MKTKYSDNREQCKKNNYTKNQRTALKLINKRKHRVNKTKRKNKQNNKQDQSKNKQINEG